MARSVFVFPFSPMRALVLALIAAGVLVACGSGGDAASAPPVRVAPPAPPPPAPAPPPSPPPVSSSGAPKLTIFASGLAAPWGLAFLPDARMIVTEKAGTMRIVSADGKTIGSPLSGVPPVNSGGQGGLLDITVDPDFATNAQIFWSYSEDAASDSSKRGTAVYRAKLQGNALTDGRVIFRMNEYVNSSGHYGSRLAFAPDKSLFITFGDRQSSSERDKAQDLSKHHGKVVRITREGQPLSGAFIANAASATWSYGHRNPQGAAIHPTTGELWVSEHGPQGGDEINIARLGKNYGWPTISYGCEYGTTPQETCVWAGGAAKTGMEQPLTYWRPLSVAPSNLMFYTGDKFPEWKGSLFMGAMAGNPGGQRLWRMALNATNDGIASREELFASANERIRDVDQGPDGWIYLLTDSGNIIRIER
jgi:aldose sugar dehydrogenase